LHDASLRELDQLRPPLPAVRRPPKEPTAALDIDSVDGTRTVVLFRSPMLPEMLDKAVE
jgi:hypothetical protein